MSYYINEEINDKRIKNKKNDKYINSRINY